MSQFLAPPAGEPIPPGRIRGMDLARVAWAVIRATWRALLPAAAVMSTVSAVVQCVLAIWVYGSLSRAADFSFALDGSLARWLQKPTEKLPENLWRSVGSLLAGDLVLPTVVTVAAALVVLDIVRSCSDDWRGYTARALSATPRAVTTTVISTVVASSPLLLTSYVAWRLRDLTSNVASGQSNVAVPVYSLLVLLLLGLPALAWLVYATARLSLSVQVMVADSSSPIASVRTAWHITRGHVARVLGITLLTSVTAGSLGLIVAAPVTLIGTISTLGQQEPTVGKTLVQTFLTTSVGGTVTLMATGVIAALLTLDVRRAQPAAQ